MEKEDNAKCIPKTKLGITLHLICLSYSHFCNMWYGNMMTKILMCLCIYTNLVPNKCLIYAMSNTRGKGPLKFIRELFHLYILPSPPSLICVLCTKCMERTHYELIVSVCPHDSTREPLDGLGWNLVWVLWQWGLPQNRTFEYPAIGDNKMTDEESREVDRQ
jgi:hypothetical protein